MSSNYDGRDALQQLRLHFSGGPPAEEERQPQNGLEKAMQSASKAIAGARAKTRDAYNTRLDANDNAWWLFARTNRVRLLCLRICAWPWFGRIILALVLASCLVMALDDPGCTDACKQEAVLTKVVSPRCERCDMYKKASVVLDLFFTTAFTIEIIIKSIGHNFCFGPDAYLKSGWNWIDFLSTASGYLRYLPIGESGGLSGVRAMRALRPLRALNAVPGLRMLVETLLEAVPLLIDVLMLLTWVFFVFGIVALNLFMGKMHNRCMILVDPSQADANLTTALSNLSALIANGSGSAGTPPLLPPSWPPPWPPLPPGANGSRDGGNASALVWELYPGMDNTVCSGSGPGILKCPEDGTCRDTNTNPNYGYTSFDNFAAASYCIFQMLTLDAWTSTLLYPLMNAIGPALPIPYFTLLVLFGAFFAMQLLVAILSSKFAQLSAQRPKKRKKRRRRRAHTPPDTTDDDDDDDDDEDDDREDNDSGQPRRRRRLRKPPLGRQLRRWWRPKWYHFHKEYLTKLRRKDLPPWRAFFWDVTYSIWFNNIMTGFILANTVTLGLEHYGMGTGMLYTLEIINLGLTAGFILEFVIKHLGCGIVGYWRDPWNILDGLIVVLSIVEIILTYGPASGGGTNTQSLRTFRLLRILRSLKLLARVEALRKLMRMVIKGFVALKDFMLLLLLFIFIFSILGLQQFGGAASFAPAPQDVGYTANFDTLWQSAYTVFQLLTADSWTATSWNGMLARGTAACLYFIAWIVIGNFVLLTLFLAILITNFQSDEDVEPTEEELNANPYAPDDQSETASTLGGSTLGGEPGSSGPQNALGQRVVGRTQEKDVYAMKKWLVMLGYYHGMKHAEVSDISQRMDDMFARHQSMFVPFARTDILNYDERDQVRERERERERDSSVQSNSLHGSPGPGTGHGGRSSALRRVSNPLSAALSKFGAQLQSIGGGPTSGDRERHSNPEATVPLSPADAGLDGGAGLKRMFGGRGAGGGEGGGGGGKVLGRRSAPLSRAVRNTSADQPDVGPQMRPMDTVAEEGEQGVNVTVTARGAGDRVTPGRMLPSRPGDARALRSHRSAQVREENRPTLMTVQTPRSSLPTSVAAALEAVRTSLQANHVSWRPSDSGLELHRVESGARVHTGHNHGHGHSHSHDHGHDHDPEQHHGASEGGHAQDEAESPSPVRRRREFVEQWRTWFDDADSAPASSFTASCVLRTGSTDMKTAGVGLPRAASVNAAAAAAAATADRASLVVAGEPAHSRSGSLRKGALGPTGTALHIRSMAKSSSDRCTGQEQLLMALVASAAVTDGPATPDGGDGGLANHGSSSPRSRQQATAAAQEQLAAQPADTRHAPQGPGYVPGVAGCSDAITASGTRLAVAQQEAARLSGNAASSRQPSGRSLPRCWSTSQMDGAQPYSESAGAYVANGYSVGLHGSSHPSPRGSVSRAGLGSGVPSSPCGPESTSDAQASSRASPQRRGRAGASAADISASPASSSVSPTRGVQPQSAEAAPGLLMSAISVGVRSVAGSPEETLTHSADGAGGPSSREHAQENSSHTASTLTLAPPATLRRVAAAGGYTASPASTPVLRGGDSAATVASSSTESLPGESVLRSTSPAQQDSQRGSAEMQTTRSTSDARLPFSRMAWASPSSSATKLSVHPAAGPALHEVAPLAQAGTKETGRSSDFEPQCHSAAGDEVEDAQSATWSHGSPAVSAHYGMLASSYASRTGGTAHGGRNSCEHSIGSHHSFAFTSPPVSVSGAAPVSLPGHSHGSVSDTRSSLTTQAMSAAGAAQGSLQGGWAQPQHHRPPVVVREPLLARHLRAAAAMHQTPTMTTMTATPTALSVTAAETFGEGSGGDLGTSGEVRGESFLSRESFAFMARSAGQGRSSGSGSGSPPSPNYFGPYVPYEQPATDVHGAGHSGAATPAPGGAAGAGGAKAGEPDNSLGRVLRSDTQQDSPSLASTSCASWLPATTATDRPNGPAPANAVSGSQIASRDAGLPAASGCPVAEGVAPGAMDATAMQLSATASPQELWAAAAGSRQEGGDWWRPVAVDAGVLAATGASGPVAEAVAMASSISAERRARNRQHGTSAQRAESGVPNEDPYPYLKFSAFIFLAPYQPFRMKLQTIVSNKWFEGAIMLMILISSVMLALDRPTLDPASPMAEAVKIIEWTINILFAIEMIMKMLLKGFIWHRDAYWRNGWDILDGLIVITSLVSMAAPSIAFFRTLRLLRVLRPLRMVSRVRGMRMVVETLIMSLPAVANVLLFGGFMFGIFGILGTQLYMGRTSRCNQNTFANGTAVLDKSMCVPGVFICTDDDICDTIGAPTNRTWVTPYRNFDHLGRSLLTLFIVATLDGYMDTLQAVIDAVGVDKQPQYNHAPYMGMYVISFVFLGSFFWLNLLVSVIIDYYSRLMMQEEGMLADKSMREWMKLLQFTARPSKDIWRSIPVPKNPLRARCWGVASSPYFDNFIMGIIMANVLVMALPHEGSTQTFEDTLAYFNAAFTMVFIFEAVVKNMAMGPRVYIKDNWNKLDLFIVITSIPDLLSLVVPMDSGTGVMTVFRIMRIGRMFKLIKNARGLRTLFNTLISSLPAIANVGSLLFLLMFIYAVLGMNLFGTPGNPFEGDPDSNFNNVGASLVVLFQVFTGDGWSAVMAQASGCDSFEFQCKTNGQALVAAMFFCSFIMLANFVMLNLVIAVILDNFITSAKDEGLLTISNFSETMSKVISLRIFVRSLRTKIELMKAVEELKSFASHDANGGTGATPLLTRDRRAKSRKKPSAINIPLAGVLGKQGESSPAATAGGSLEAAGSMLGRIGTGLGATQGRSSHLSIPSRDEGHSIKRSDSRDATNHSSYFGAIRRALTRQGSSDGGDGAMAAPTRTHGGEESEMGRSRTVSIDGGVGGPAASTLGLTTFLRRRRISSASDV